MILWFYVNLWVSRFTNANINPSDVIRCKTTRWSMISSRVLLEDDMSPGFPAHLSENPSTFEIRTNSEKSSRPGFGRWDACRATASRIEDRWYALGGWLQRSEINLQFKSVGVRARGSSDCRAASAAMISLNRDRFDNGERRDPREIESRSTAFRFVYLRFEVPDPSTS